MRWLLLLTPLFFSVSIARAATQYVVDVVERAPQDPTLFTQGFEIDNGWFYQSSGLYGKSYLLRYPQNGEGKAKRLDVPANVFAEGITVFNRKLYLLSWKAGTAWRFNADTLQLEKTYHFGGEGWGLAHNDTQLILSDGSDTLKFIDPENFGITRTVKVTLNSEPVSNLNELEYARGLIWANQWKSNTLYGVDPENGKVKITVDITSLQQEAAVTYIDSVANGIAYDAEQDLFWITGKYWNARYLVRFLEPQK